eukprot:SAG31_NODE_2334_length_5929_cov_1.453516_6_plen_57_part_00
MGRGFIDASDSTAQLVEAGSLGELAELMAHGSVGAQIEVRAMQLPLAFHCLFSCSP